MPESKLYSEIIARLPIGIVRAEIVRAGGKPADLIIRDVNPQAAHLLELPENMLLGKSVRSDLPSVSQESLKWLCGVGSGTSDKSEYAFDLAAPSRRKPLRVKIWPYGKDMLCLAFSEAAPPLKKDDRASVMAIHRVNQDQEILIHISAMLLRAVPDNLEEIVHQTMAEAAKIATADRVYVFAYDFVREISINTYEWCAEGISPQIDRLQNVPFEQIREWIAAHKLGKTIAIDDIAALPKENPTRAALEPQEIQSVIAVPLFLETELYGFIGFDSVRRRHIYTPKEEQILLQYGNNLLSTIVRVQFEQALRKSEARYRFEKDLYQTTLLSVGDSVVSTDILGNIIFANRAFEQLTGLCSKVVEGKPLADVFLPIDEQTKEKLECPVRRVLETGCSVDPADNTALVTGSGRERSIEYVISPVFDANRRIQGAVLVFWDVSEKRAARRQIEYLGTHDSLTGLLNRHSFGQEIRRILVKESMPLSLLVIDVNGLKLTNDAFGHAAGDLLIQKVARILSRACDPRAMIFRMGGDEFIALLPHTDENGVKAAKARVGRLAAEETPGDVVISVAIGCHTIYDAHCDVFSAVKEAESDMYREKVVSGRKMRNQTIELIVGTINSTYQQERQHTDRVACFCRQIGTALHLTENEIMALEAAGALHDIGKVIVPKEVLNKPGSLTAKEYALIKRHPETGYQILRSVDDLAVHAEVVLCHHERWDGGGYPQGLKGEEIPFYSRIIAIADAFEAMTAKRVYRDAMSFEAAIEELEKNAGSQFDPHITEIFVRLLRETAQCPPESRSVQ
ncbi:MAG TPA: diguanylate cyclase [Eubacteriales bacterium]|nr:diguanylate cyclase [Eubacteriales bacterium]